MVAVATAVHGADRPALYILLRLYVLVPLAAGRIPIGFGPVVRALHQVSRWNMLEVLTVGGLLSLVRLAALAEAVPGPAMFALGVLTVLFAAIEAAGLRHLWVVRPVSASTTADRAAAGALSVDGPLLGCESCGHGVARRARGSAAGGRRPALLAMPSQAHHEKPFSLQRTWSCVIAAAILYIPANALPVMSTTSAFDTSTHTLLGGIHDLWVDGAWGLAVIVFVASIAVPVPEDRCARPAGLERAQGTRLARLERARLFRLIEVVGHWSMLDVYVVVLLACVRLRVAGERPPGARPARVRRGRGA
jgi:paraquat-inducible protein A